MQLVLKTLGWLKEGYQMPIFQNLGKILDLARLRVLEYWDSLFFLSLTLINLIFINQSNALFRASIPFYDAIDYQSDIYEILQKNASIFRPRSTLYTYFYKIFGRFLAPDQLSPSVFLVLVMTASVVFVFYILYKLTNSKVMASAGIVMFYATAIFGATLGGPIDQRFDLATAFFYMSFLAAIFCWYNSKAYLWAVVAALMLTLTALHRIIVLAQIAPFILIFLCLLHVKAKQGRKVWREEIVFCLSFLILFFCTHFKRLSMIYNYYVFNNDDVGKAPSVWSSFVFFYDTATGHLKNYALIFSLGTILLLWVSSLSREKVKTGLLVFSAFISPFIVPVLTKSYDNPYIILTVLGVIPFFILLISEKWRRLNNLVLTLIYIACLLQISSHLKNLKTNLIGISRDKNQLSEMVLAIYRDSLSSKDHSLMISGFACGSVCVESVSLMGKMDFRLGFDSGLFVYHWSDFGLKQRDGPKTPVERREEVIRLSLDKMKQIGGYVVLNNLAQPETAYLASSFLMPQILKIVEGDPDLINTGIEGHFGNETVYVYRFK